MFGDHYLRTFRYRRIEIQSKVKLLKNDLDEEPNWKVHVPVLYQCIMKNVIDGVPKQVVRFPESTHIVPLKPSSF